jgi:hypothetical protein
MMTEGEIRQFVDEIAGSTGDRACVVERIAVRWLQDQQDAADEARDAVYDDARDGWSSNG